MKALQKRLSIADPKDAAKKQRAIKDQIDLIKNNIEKCLSIVSKDSLDNIKVIMDTAKQKRKDVLEGAQALATVTKLDGIGSETWRKLWLAAREYSVTVYQEESFPYIGENALCPLCQQKLDDKAKDRLQKFEAFIRDKLETEAQESENLLETKINNLHGCPDETTIKSMCQASELDEEISDEIKTVFSHLSKVIETIKVKQIDDIDITNIQNTDKLIKKLTDLSNNAEKTAIQFDTDAESFDYEKENEKLIEFEAKKWISEQKKAVEEEITRLKSLEQYEKWKKHTATNVISREASNISEKLITEAYISRFNEELKKLNANRITVELVKAGTTKGRSKHKIILKNLVYKDIDAIEILSDGEKRIVALAAFLADMTGRKSNTPFIFDDPISSLDQEYEEKTIERLVELSKERQVIIFTHRLSFLSIIMDKTEKAKIKSNIIHINREPWGTGNPSEMPIYGTGTKEALNKLKNDRLIIAKKTFESEGNAAYYPLGKAICSDFRIILERIVENFLLAGIVLRYRRDIQTKNKLSKLLIISKPDCDIIDELMTKYSYFEHSQPPESQIIIPEPLVLDTDLDKLINWHNDFKKRQDNA
jgi:hypothetical protein